MKSLSRLTLRNAFDILGVGLVLAAVFIALYYWDPSRAYLKQALTSDEYLYDKVEPALLAQDPAAYIHVRDADAVSRIRDRAIDVIWGMDGLPEEGLPDEVIRDLDKRASVPQECQERRFTKYSLTLSCEVGNYAGWDNLAGIDDLKIAVGQAYIGSVGYFRPRRANGVLVIYQHGFAGTYHAQYRYLKRLIAEGYTVAATNVPWYGDNICRTEEARSWCDVSAGVFDVPLPLRVYFTPLAKTINFALRDGRVRHVAIVGFSGGAWIASVMAAVDTRIGRSYPVAGVIPFYMRRAKEWPPNQFYAPLMEAASMLDLFILGGSGPGRRQIQFFNRFDRCCYNGPRPLQYEDAVQTAVQITGDGAFDVVLDETHARHKISRWAFERILKDLQRPWGQ